MRNTLPDRVRLGIFEVDLRAGELRDGDRIVCLREQSLSVLRILVERAGEIVTRELLKQKLWPNDTIVDFDHGINAAIRRLRQALGDSADEPKYIETLARRGYRLMVPVETVRADEPSGEIPAGVDGVAVRRQADLGLIGKKVSHYRVLEVLGGGGGGMLYKAEDLKLPRQVALKFLPEELARDPIALERFEREARASSLDHPNICTIYDVEEYEGQPFIVMQLLRGQTLRDRLAELAAAGKRFELDELLSIATQICDGLQAAHDQGVIHRDIKPANIFLTSIGQAKILDFGLAKLVSATEEAANSAPQSGDAAVAPQPARSLNLEQSLTQFGVAVGTAGYMSPEQIRGEKLDPRTDIFSFGLVLYEMATGQRAFAGETAAIVHNAIVNDAPVPVRQRNPEVPREVEATINKALEKDREKRYQNAAELGRELHRLQSAVGETRQRRLMVASVVVLMIGIAVTWFFSRRTAARPESVEHQLTANPTEDYVISGAISPNGKYLIYDDQTGMYLRTIDTGETRPVTVPEELRGRIADLCWMPGGEKFLATVSGSDGYSDIWVFTDLGKAYPHLLYRHGWQPAVSPDGQRIAFIGERGRELWVGGINGKAPQRLITTGQMEYIFGPAWSPDSRWIAYGRWKMAKNSWSSAIEVRPASGGPEKTLITDSSLPNSGAHIIGENGEFTESWTPDWRLVFSAAGASEVRPSQVDYSLWQIQVAPRHLEPSGKPGRLTQPSESSLERLTHASDGKRLSYVKSRSWMGVYVGELGPGYASMKPPRRLTLDTRGGYSTAWTRDGQSMLFDSARNGKWEIFRQGMDQNVAEVMVSSPGNANGAEMSPDGLWLLYWESDPSPPDGGTPPDSVRLMRHPIGGGPSERMLELRSAQRGTFSCSSNSKAGPPCVLCLMEGKALIFYSLDPLHGRGRELGRIAISTYGGAMRFAVAPDGSRLAMVDDAKYKGRIEVLTLEDGTWHEVVFEPEAESLQSIAWAADGKSFFATSVAPDSFNLLHITFAGKVDFLLRNGRQQWLTRPVLSPDGKHLAYSAQTWDSNVWMIANF